MDEKLFLQMASLEDSHWWFVARRTYLSALISKIKLPEEAKILEAGCGTGGNLEMLARYGRIFAFEMNDFARSFAQNRVMDYAEIRPGHLPDNLPFEDNSFDLIVLFDVLEHLENDIESLRALYTLLKPGGYLLITVPALPLLWSNHDESHGHFRRYLKGGLKRLVRDAGYKIEIVSYFNSILFPAIFGIRFWKRLFKVKDIEDLALPPIWINKFLKFIFETERHFIGRVQPPTGVSLVLFALKVQQ